MSTLTLTIAYFDDASVHEWEFKSLDSIRTYLEAGDDDRISMAKLYDANTDVSCEGIDAIHQYISENTGPKLELLPADVTNSMENSEWVVDPFDTYEPGELPPNAPKSSCIVFTGVAEQIDPVPLVDYELPIPVRFRDLPDGAEFYLAQTYAYGGRQKYQKVLEDGGEHNAVWCNDHNTTARIPDAHLVIRA
jgi:hypothetical protein